MEEPPEGVVFILLSDNEKALLPTVLSRTIRFRLSPLKREYFEDFGDEIFLFSGGNLGKAKLLAEKAEENDAKLFLEAVVSGNTYDVLKFIKGSYKKRNETEQLLDGILVILKNSLVKLYSYQDGNSLENKICQKWAEDKIFEIIEETERLRELTVRNISAESILIRLFFKIKD
jgi:DNA polymerase-3 subunit delta'